MTLQGFNPRWKDFPDYILGITHEIWEEQKVETLNHYYTPDLIVRSPASVVVGNQAVIAATHATLEEFPDRELLGEDVIWSGTPEAGLLSSHRILSTATHAKDGVYGKATGKKLEYRVIADCHAINDQINDEWLVRDQGHIVRQLGLDPKEFTQEQIAREGGPNKAVRPFTPMIDQAGPYQGRGNDNDWGMRLGNILTQIAAGERGIIKESYDRACHLEYAGGITAHSFGGAEDFWEHFLASFPDATFTIEHQIGREDPMLSPRAAIRWGLAGKHSGEGLFGAPTGADVYVLGMTHAEFGPWGLRREYTLFDETAVWKQILLQEAAP
ncbi:MAG: ester cyclase [Pseudomonadota bacterium]